MLCVVPKGLEYLDMSLEGESEALFWICNQVRIPCDGTHVNYTRQIGAIALKRRFQGKSWTGFISHWKSPKILDEMAVTLKTERTADHST